MRAVTSIALFMVTLDNLVVTTALPVIRRELDASLQELEWTINAYTLTFAALLLTGAALGDRFGRRRGVTFQAALTHPELTWLVSAGQVAAVTARSAGAGSQH